MVMFGFRKKNYELQEKDILNSKIELTKLKEKLKVMLTREIATARKLKAQGMKSQSNYSKIGIAYYLLQIVSKAYNRLDDIKSSSELSEMMNGLSGLLGSINQIGTQTEKPKAKGLMAGLESMQAAEKAQNNSLAGILKGLGTNVTEPSGNDISGLVGLDVIERLINGNTPEMENLPADAVPITSAPVQTAEPVQKPVTEPIQSTQPTEIYDEMENLRRMQELINKL